jgi:hypothetical protein
MASNKREQIILFPRGFPQTKRKASAASGHVGSVLGNCFMLQGFWKSRSTNWIMRQRRRPSGSTIHASMSVSTELVYGLDGREAASYTELRFVSFSFLDC